MGRYRSSFREISELYTDLMSYALCTEAEELDLLKKVREGDRKARHELISRNIRLVITIAAKMRRPQDNLNDLIGEGVRGLIVAVDRFDLEKGVKLANYASGWIQRFILNSFRPGNGVMYVSYDSWKFFFNVKYGHVPLETLTPRQHLRLQDVSRVLSHNPVRLDGFLDNKEGETSVFAPGDDDPLESHEVRTKVHESLSRLSPREREVITLRYGIGGEEPMTLKDVAGRVGVTRERVRQVQLRAEEKMRGRLRSVV